MATITTGHNAPTGFTSGEVVTATKLNDHVNSATVTAIQTADISDAQITTAKIADANVTFAKLAAPQYTGFRNRIINGNFDIWQRGTSFSTDYGADRWVNQNAGSTCTMSRQAFTLGQTDVPNEPTYFCRMAVTSSAGAGNYVILNQRIEDVRTLAGQSATISFYAKADSSKSIAIEFVQLFGTGGSPSSLVTAIGSQKFNLTSSWQKFTATIAIPSISGKTLGSNNNSTLVFSIWLDAGSDFNSRTDTLGQQSGTFDIAQVQVEAGTVATPFEARPIGTELALCQRYYQVSGDRSVAFNADFTSAQFKTNMRATPTVVVTPSSGTISNLFVDVYGFYAQNTTTSNASFTASAEL